MTTGEKIASLRRRNEITQDQLANLLNVSRQSVSRWEMNNTFPEVEKLIKISKLFQCSIDYLLSEEIQEKEELALGISADDCAAFIYETGHFFLATSVDNHPRLRPFGMIFPNKKALYIATDKRKSVYADLEQNPNVELASYNMKSKKWIRVTGKVFLEESIPLRQEMMSAYPILRQKYSNKEEAYLAIYQIELHEVSIH